MADNVLVTGGAGFIGSHFCEALLAHGEKVLCLDNFCHFYSPESKRQNIAELMTNPAFELLEADIRDYDDLDSIFSNHSIDTVIHLAAMAGVRPSIQDPGLYTSVNVAGTMNLLEACTAHAVQRFIFASSSSVYGNSSPVPFSEADPVNDPISPYAATKKSGEMLCRAWHNLYGMSILCLRFFTVYGPRQRPDLAIRKFTSLMLAGKPIPVYGDGSSSRDYTYIDDTVAGILKALEYARTGSHYDVINLGNDRGITLTQMISALEKVSGITARRELHDFQEGDVMHTRADISKAGSLLGYEPQVAFEEGLARFWEWMREQGS
jgi:UDP-glucuronate 4-epimerase